MRVALLLGLVVPTALPVLLILLPWERRATFGFKRVRTPPAEDVANESYTRTTLRFASAGDSLEAWLYLPRLEAQQPPPPVLLFAHGFGGQKDMGLDEVGDHMARAGFAVLLFDCRGFGGSDGEPRYWVSPSRHLEDYLAAVRFVKEGGLAGAVDASRVGLLGVSWSASFSLGVAAKMPADISAIVGLVPFVSSKAGQDSQSGLSGLDIFRLLLAGASDLLRLKLGLPRVYLPMVGPPDEFCMGKMPIEDRDLLLRLVPGQPQGGWDNKVTPSVLWEAATWRPEEFLPHVQCPVLLLAGSRDTVLPAKHAQQAARVLPHPGTEYHEFDETHMSLGMSPEVKPLMVSFLNKHL